MGQLSSAMESRGLQLPVVLILLVFAGQPLGVQGVVGGNGVCEGGGGAVAQVTRGETSEVQLRSGGGVVHTDQGQTGHI